MVASFPEYDYTKNRPNNCKAGCVPLVQKPTTLRSALQPKPSAHSTLMGKILSFHGSFSYSNRNTQKDARVPCLGDSVRKLTSMRIKSTSAARQWNSFKSSSSHSSMSGLQQNNSDVACRDGAAGLQESKLGVAHNGDLSVAGSDSPSKQGISEMGNQLASKMGKGCSSPSSAITQLGNFCSRDGELDSNKCDRIGMDDCGCRSKNGCGSESHHEQHNVGMQKSNSIDVGAKPSPQSLEQSNGGGSENPLYASDNSSNNMRWSSTSCASTDTSSSNGTRRTSCESRISLPSVVPPAFLAKPHKAHDVAWAAIRSLQLRLGGAPLAMSHFNLIRRVGHGDIGIVFLAHLKDKLVASASDTACLFAIKVMDKEALSQKSKLQRMHMEKEILECVDHPFLPTLYAHFDSEHYSCLVMDFCPCGDLYALRQKQPGKRFGLIAARFYAAEVLLALEYLHMLGIVYRDLKPENVLVREDGHIMLTDFDLSFKCDVKPELVKHPLLLSASLSNSCSKRRLLRSYSQSSTISTSSTTSFLHHESSNCRLSITCGIDPILSCLALADNTGKRAPQMSKQELPIGFSLLSSKASKASHDFSFNHKARSISEPLKQDVLCLGSTGSTSNDASCGDGKSGGDRESAEGARICTTRSRSHPSEAEESYDSPSAQKSHRAFTSDLGCQEEDDLMFMELVAEPTQGRSMSFVGTHEYLAPEIIAGHGHGSQVDWWTFGIFLYELLYGRSPFKGASNDQTLINIVRKDLRFPETAGPELRAMEDAKSLIRGLLVKDLRERLGCTKGAAEIKQHAFFKGVNWALIRCTQPPQMPSPFKRGMHASSNHHHYQSKSVPHFDYF